MQPDLSVLAALTSALGPAGVLTQPSDMAAYATDQRGIAVSAPVAVLRPASTQETAAAVRLCAAAGLPIVPQGGNTGLAGGAVARPERPAALLNLGRMDRIRELDALDYTVTVEAGCILQRLREAADAADRQFPLSLAAEGSCTVGGILSTNAGGVMTLRYGNARDLVLGLEVVLADGQVWQGLRRLRKDNTGYDLKHLFLGAEGTLGIITAATLKLFPRPRRTDTLFAALPDPDAAIALSARLRNATADALTAFELVPRFAIDGAARYLGEQIDPLPAAPSPWYALVELTSGSADGALRRQAEAALAAALDEGLIQDAVFAESEAQRRALWRVREAPPEIGRKVGGALHHDVSVPVSRVPAFIAEATAAVTALVPGCRPYPFGHVADGNIHYNIARPETMSGEAFLARGPEVKRRVHDIALAHNGSISAEHGIGLFKRDELQRVKPALELELMRRMKAALDPAGIMNPGKVLPEA
jgi:FAD/FMN-containing dehydrogenase